MRRAILICGLALLMVSCTKEQATTDLEGVKQAREVAREASAHADTSIADDDFGVPECDDYVSKVSACVDEKVPADDQPAIRFQLDSQKKKWREMAKDPVSRASLGEECRSASSIAAQSMAKYGCTF